MNSLDVIARVLELNSGIVELSFVELEDSRVVQHDMEMRVEEKRQIERAMDIRAHHYFPFWDCLCSTFINNEGYSKRLLGLVFRHNYNNDVVSIPRGQFPQIQELLAQGRPYAILSKVLSADGKAYHLPLIDFHCDSADVNVQLAVDLLEIIGIGPGYLLDSGESFHFIGTQLIEAADFGPYLGRLSMFSPIVDKSWIAHQLIEGSCALRITQKRAVVPSVVREIGID